MSTANAFQQNLGAEIAAQLGSTYKFFKSRLELRADVPEGHNVIVLSGSNKYSPYIEVSFYFGKNFAAVKRIEKLLGEHQFYYHIQQYSPNRASLTGLPYTGPYTWSVDITKPTERLAAEMAQAINGIAGPFFSRFSEMRAARDAIATGDRWCFGGAGYWNQVLLLDLALGDLAHFESWSENLDTRSLDQAREEISKFMAAQK